MKDPVQLVGIQTEALESMSKLLHSDANHCPKCKKPFGTANIEGDQVFYCESCRVTHPMPNI